MSPERGAPRGRVSFAVGAIAAASLAAGESSLIDLYEGVQGAGRDVPPMVELADEAATAMLAVTVRGVSGETGTVRVFVYDDAEAWAAYDYTSAVGYAELPARGRSLEARLPVLSGGPYAVFAFHDENDDAELNTARGAPLEGYGHSGATNPYFAPAFSVAASRDDAVVELVYPGPRPR